MVDDPSPITSQNFDSVEQWILSPASPLPDRSHLVGMDDLSKAIVLLEASRRSQRPCLAVFNRGAEARQVLDHLLFFGGAEIASRVHYLPSLDFDFHRGLLPNPDVLCDRNVSLFHALNDPQGRIFLTTLKAISQKTIPEDEFFRLLQVLKKEEEIDRDQLIFSLLEAGYQRQPAAYDPGVFSVRGGVIDVFCPLYPNPVRLEFFGDFIEQMRFFDPTSQRSLDELSEAYLVPVGQSVMPHGADFEAATLKIKERLDALGIQKGDRDDLVNRVRDGQNFPELSLIFPLLSKGSQSPFDYFPEETLHFWDGEEQTKVQARDSEFPSLLHQYHLYVKAGSPIADEGDLFVDEASLETMLTLPNTSFFESFSSPEYASSELTLKREAVSLTQERESIRQRVHGSEALKVYADRMKQWMDLGYCVHIICHTQTHAERVQTLFEPYEIPFQFTPEGTPGFPQIIQSESQRVRLWQGFINESGVFPKLKIVLLGEEELFGRKKRASRSAHWGNSSDPARMFSSFRDLKVGDFVVHKEHGIGKYLGLKSMDFQGMPNDYVHLEYRDGDKLYVPVYRLNVLQKYVGKEGGAVPLDKLGGERWGKAKGKAKKAIQELAVQFLEIQAKRKIIPAHAFAPPGPDFQSFEMEFPFDETPDQMKSIEDVMDDLSKPNPMDRLICGDVGYGKTEVAMRAAYRAVLGGKQVALLVPTTVLAFQHYESFKKRFEGTGSVVELVCRLRTSQQTKEVLKRTKEGKVDVLIGTHRLLSSDVQFKDLHLIIIDEEHRFGVVHKEKLKKLSQSVHSLTMTATPIPRTLNMAMTGIKDISVITTPPPDRLSVRTFVCRRTSEVIKEAIQTELNRGGQIFFVHNRVQSLDEVATELREWVPKLRIEMVHGQMDARELEKRMLRFYQGEADVLLSTTIIESGLDIPRANTIIIDRADHFGLAQLYQLRGRVGRSEKRAYCFLLAPNENQITKDAKERLQVIQRYTELGAGFHVASHDLELRGAGDLLGKDQSGHLAAIGVDYYFELLEQAIQELKGVAHENEIEPEINLKISAHFPDYYLPDISERISVYRRLSSVQNEEQVSEVEEEIRDRFGALPEEVSNLLGLMRIKLYLKRLHVIRMGCGPKRTSLQFAPTTPLSPEKLVSLIQSDPKRYAITPDQRLIFEVEDGTWSGQLRQVQKLAEQLGLGD